MSAIRGPADAAHRPSELALVGAGAVAVGRARARAVDRHQDGRPRHRELHHGGHREPAAQLPQRVLVDERHVKALALRADVDPQPQRHRQRLTAR
jgi:hypothetical protein